MKKSVIVCACCITLLAFSIIVGLYEAHAEINAESQIFIYNQQKGTGYWTKCSKCGKWVRSAKGYWSEQTIKYGNIDISKSSCGHAGISQRGCGLFAVAHAYQWLAGKKMSTDEEKAGLLIELLRQNNNPPGGLGDYFTYFDKKYGFAHESIGKSVGSKYTDVRAIKSCFDKGNIMIYMDSGKNHFSLAVGYTERNGLLYIQIVDSNASSTVSRTSYGAFKYNDFSAWKPDTNSNTSNYGQYWIRWDDFKKFYAVAILSSDHSIQLAKANASASLSYAEKAVYSIISECYGYAEPKVSTKYVETYVSGDLVEIVEVYEDATGKIFYKTIDNTYIISDYCAYYQSLATYWVTGIQYASSVEGTPSGKLTKGNNFGLRGTVYSSDSITDVIGYIYRADGSIEMQSNPMNLTGTATSVDIRYSNVNNNLKFEKLENGVYRYEVIVYTRHGESKVIESVFGVGVEPNIPLTGISFENGYKTLSLNAATAETFTLVPKYSPSNTAETGVIWSSSDSSVATVSESGVVKAVASGSATITAVSKVHSEISVSCEVSVYSRITSFTLDRERVDISTADGVSSFDLTANVQPAGTACDFEWCTSNSAVATVSGTNGNVCTVLLTGNTGGAVITAKVLDGSGLEKTCVINVADPSASSLKITNFAYPVTYKISSTGFNWSYSGSGSFSSNYDLTELQINIYYGTAGTKISYSHPIPAGTKSITMNTKDSKGNTVGHYIAMSKVDKAGYGKIEVIVSDASGARISRSATFNAVTSGTTATSSFSTTYTSPTLVAEKELNGHKYQLYKSSYTWNQVNDYANSLGGHLATISDENENKAINSLIQGISSTAAWLGGYHDSNGWHWVTGEPFAYTHWASDAPSYTCGQEDKLCIWNSNSNWNDEMANYKHDYFVVEYESQIESIAFTQNFVNLTRERDRDGYLTGIEITLREDLEPEMFRYPKIVYKSMDTSVVTVNQSGMLTPVCDAGQTLVCAWPENEPDKVAYLQVGCYTITHTEFNIEESYHYSVVARDPGAVIVRRGTEYAPALTYWYDGYIFGEDAFFFRSASQGEDTSYDQDYDNTEDIVIRKIDFGLFYAEGSGYDMTYCRVEDENGDTILYDYMPVYVLGDDEEIRLPSGTKTVETEAFENTGARYLVVPAGVESIESGAFTGMELDVVVFMGANTEVSDGAFSGYPTFMCLEGGKTERMLCEQGMFCPSTVYIESN